MLAQLGIALLLAAPPARLPSAEGAVFSSDRFIAACKEAKTLAVDGESDEEQSKRFQRMLAELLQVTGAFARREKLKVVFDEVGVLHAARSLDVSDEVIRRYQSKAVPKGATSNRGKRTLIVGVVDKRRAVEQLPEGLEAITAFKNANESFRREVEGEFDPIRLEMQDLEKRKSEIPPEAFKERATRVHERLLAFQQSLAKAEASYFERERAATNPIAEKLRDNWVALALRDGFSIVLDSDHAQVLFVSPGHDLTNDILRPPVERAAGTAPLAAGIAFVDVARLVAAFPEGKGIAADDPYSVARFASTSQMSLRFQEVARARGVPVIASSTSPSVMFLDPGLDVTADVIAASPVAQSIE